MPVADTEKEDNAINIPKGSVLAHKNLGKRGRDWTKGSISRNLLSLSWPIMVSDGLRTIGPTIDLIWIGKLGADSVAGVGVAGMAVMAVMAGRIGISAGMRAMIAHAIGNNDTRRANHIAQQGLVVSAAYAILVAVIGILFTVQILTLLGVEPNVVTQGAAYMRIQLIGTFSISFLMMAETMMQASGDTITPMKITIFYRAIHLVLCPFLIFGWWFFPRLGVSGAAITSIISQSIGMTLGIVAMFTGISRLKITLSHFHFDLKVIWGMLKIGLPAVLMQIQQQIAGLLFVWVITPFGTFAVASHTLLQRVSMFVHMPSKGLSLASGILMGQNLGARQPDRAAKSAWTALFFAEATLFVFAIVMLVWPGKIIGIFNTEPGMIEIGSNFLMISVVAMMLSFDMVFMDSLSGAGDTLPPMLISILATWLVPVPLAFILPNVGGLGVYGIRWALVAGRVAGSLAALIYFRLGKWKRIVL